MIYPKGRSRAIKNKALLQGKSEYVANQRSKSSWCSLAKRELRRKATPSEIVFMNKLLDAGFIFHDFQKSFISGDRIVIADFYIRKPKRVVIEVDGGYHFTKDQLIKDLEKDKYLLSIKQVDYVLRLSASQAHNITTGDLLKTIRELKKGEVTCLYNR